LAADNTSLTNAIYLKPNKELAMPTPEAIMPLNVDSTMITCARSCLEKFRLEFVYGLRPSGISVDLHAGGCFATSIEAFRRSVYEANMPQEFALKKAQAAFAVAWGDFEIPDFKKTAKTFDRTWAAVEDYVAKFPPLTDHLQPYYVNGKPTFEFTFAIPLEPAAAHDFTTRDGSEGYASYDPDHHVYTASDGTIERKFPRHPSGEPWLYSGRFDMLGKYQGRPCVEDDKTQGGSISTGWADKWNLRSQFLGYVWACQQSGLDLDTVVIRGIAIQKTQTPIEEAVKVYPDHLIATWYEQLRRDLWRIRKAWDTGYFDLNLADACTTFGNCVFMNTCASHPNMKANWYNDFEVRRWNPLHKNPVSPMPEAA
jgi:hypothetical protein